MHPAFNQEHVITTIAENIETDLDEYWEIYLHSNLTRVCLTVIKIV
jgi:hypothetical protein